MYPELHSQFNVSLDLYGEMLKDPRQQTLTSCPPNAAVNGATHGGVIPLARLLVFKLNYILE